MPPIERPRPNLFPHQARAASRVWHKIDAEGFKAPLAVLATGCHDPEAILLMYDGSLRAARNINVGDTLMGPDSTPRRVLARHEGVKPMCVIRPTKGQPFKVTMDHTLTLVQTRRRNGAKYASDDRDGALVDVTVEEWTSWTKHRKHIHKLFRVPIEFPGAKAPDFDPYLAGVLLGDGSLGRRCMQVTTTNPEVVEACSAVASTYGLGLKAVSVKGRCPQYTFSNGPSGGKENPIVRHARSVGLWGMKCDKKRVPLAFKVAPRESRLETLAGLIDTDGSLSGSGYDFISKSPQLARDVIFLARSVGLAAYGRPCHKRCQTGGGGTYYRVSISGDASVIPCRIGAKKARPRRQKKDVLRTGFTVEPAGDGPYVGFTVDADHRYVMGSFVVTHNCGKTILGGDIARDVIEYLDGRVLWLAHRDELIRGAVDDLAFCGVDAFVEKADEHARGFGVLGEDPWCVVASVQTLRGRRLKSWPRDHFKLIVTDEAHHAVGGSYQAIYDWFAWDWHLGLTATPDRLDGEDLGQVYDCVADEYHLYDAIAEGVLKPIKLAQLAAPEVDLGTLSTRGKDDFSDKELEELMLPHLGRLANLAAPYAEGRRSLIFTPGVRSARHFAEVLSGLEGADLRTDFIHGDHPDRDGVWRDFREGRLRAVANCEIATEGANFPFVSNVVLARKTKSRAKLCQMVGRGTRKYPGQEYCLVTDFAFSSREHKLAKVTELLAHPTKVHAEALDMAAEIVAEEASRGEVVDLMAAIQRGESKRVEREELKRREVKRAKVKHRAVIYDAFTADDATNGQPEPEPAANFVPTPRMPATEKQVAALAKFGVKDPHKLSLQQAKAVLQKHINRIEQGLCSEKQAKYLIRLGVEPRAAWSMSRDAASATLDRLNGRNVSA